MTARPSNPLPFPTGITEADVIDLVDGVLAPEREGAVLAALKADPSLGVLAKSMRADREAVGSLGVVRAPNGLAEGIEARLEAAALRDLAKASVETPVVRIPVSQIEPQEPSVLSFLLESAWGRRLALAASLVIVAGAAALATREVLKSRTPAPIGPGIASSKPTTPSAPETAAPVTPVPAPVEIANDTTPTPTLDVGPELPPKPSTAVVAMSDERAAQLAREGRLVVSVHTADAAPSIKRLDTLAKAAGREGGWQTLAIESVPTQYATLLTPSMEAPTAVDPAAPPLTKPTIVAGSDTPGSKPDLIAPAPSTLSPMRPAVKAIYTVEIGPTDRNVQSLVRSISDGLPAGAKVVLREAPQAPAAELSLDPDNVLWWTGSPSRWIKKIKVPVVVEGLE